MKRMEFTPTQQAAKQRRRVVRFAFCTYCGNLIREGDLLHEHEGETPSQVEDWYELDRDSGELTPSATEGGESVAD